MADINLVLDLTSVPPPEADPVTQSLFQAGYHFFTLAQAKDDETTRRKLYTLVREGVCDTPGFSGEFESYEAFVERIYVPSYRNHASSQFLASHAGAWVGLSSFVPQADGQGLFGLTVVTRAHRGKGIARALKLQALRYAKGMGIDRIVTDNHPDNAPILGLNRTLGFRET